MANSAIQIKTERPRVEELIATYRDVIGDDYAGYRNHVFRTVTYATGGCGQIAAIDGEFRVQA